MKEWLCYTSWLKEKLPQYYEALNQGCTPEEISDFEQYVGFKLPSDFHKLYLLNNGDRSAELGTVLGSFLGFEFLSINKVKKIWDDFKKIGSLEEFADNYKSVPENHIKKVCFCNEWIPIFADYSGNYLGIDMSGFGNGIKGQVINFGRDEDKKYVFFNSIVNMFSYLEKQITDKRLDNSIFEEDENEYSYGLNCQSHLIDDLVEDYLKGALT